VSTLIFSSLFLSPIVLVVGRLSLSVTVSIGFRAACVGTGSRSWPCPCTIVGSLVSLGLLAFTGEADTCCCSLWCVGRPLSGRREGQQVRLPRSFVGSLDEVRVGSCVAIEPWFPIDGVVGTLAGTIGTVLGSVLLSGSARFASPDLSVFAIALVVVCGLGWLRSPWFLVQRT
jgi:hypothetical protein